MRGSLFLTGAAVLLSRLATGSQLTVDPPLCEDQTVDWLFSMGVTANIIQQSTEIIHEFIRRLQRTGGYINHRVTIGSYADGTKEGGCVTLVQKRLGLQSARLLDKKSITPNKVTVADGWRLSGFDGITRPIALKNFMDPDSKKIVVYFYDTSARLANKTDMDITLDKLDDDCVNNPPNYDYMQEAFAQRNPTLIAVKIKHKDSIDHEDKFEEEQQQFDELRKRGVKLHNIQLESTPDPAVAADYIFDALKEECGARNSLVDQLALVQSIGGCRDARDFILVFPTTPYGLNWGMNFADALTRMANDLKTLDGWNIATVTYTDVPPSSSSWGRCAGALSTGKPIKDFRMKDIMRTVTYDNNDDEAKSGLDAVFRGMLAKSTGRRPGIPAVIIYVHDSKSHVAGDRKGKKIDDAFRKAVVNNINTGCGTYDYVSVDDVISVLEYQDIFIDVNVFPATGGSDYDKFRTIQEHANGVNAIRLDMPGYAGESSYETLASALSAFCYPR